MSSSYLTQPYLIRWCVALALIVFGIAVAAYIMTPTPIVLNTPVLGNLKTDLQTPLEIYRLAGVTVQIAKGDALRLPSALRFDHFAISTKQNLDSPFRDTSIDGQVWTRVCDVPSVKNECKTDFQKQRTALWIENGKIVSDPWVVAAPPQFRDKYGIPSPIYVAGIEAADDKGTVKTDSSRIAAGVTSLCRVAKDAEHLGLPLIGAGAASLPLQDAVRGVLEGINRAALANAAPRTVTLLLFPGPQWNAYDRGEDYKHDSLAKESAEWVKLGTVLNAVLMDGEKSYMTEMPLTARRPWVISWQLSLVAFSVLVAAVVALKKRIIDRPGPIVQHLAVFIVLAVGYELGKEFTPRSLSIATLTVLVVAAFVISLWRWKRLGEVKTPLDETVPVSGERKSGVQPGRQAAKRGPNRSRR